MKYKGLNPGGGALCTAAGNQITQFLLRERGSISNMSTYHAARGVEAERRKRSPASLAYGLTIFLSAFLLFQVQPLIAKYFLPWYGGAPAVWATCLVFFQVLLLGGYSYAYLLTRRRTCRGQGKRHVLLLACSVVLLAVLGSIWDSPITPGAAWMPAYAQDPRWGLLGLLAFSVGVPYFVLSTTGPLLQAWYGRLFSGSSPYRLYALSNLGSVGALASYPFLVEPALSLRMQAHIWTWGYAAFVLCCAFCALQAVGAEAADGTRDADLGITEMETAPPVIPPSKGLCALWISLAACASLMLLATTNWICQEISVIPFLWVLPLSLYLLSFILCFQSERWYARSVFHPALALAILMACLMFYRGPRSHVLAQIGICCFALFACCMVCHGELARLKPSRAFLTRFYFWVAAGGAAGGIFVVLVAPWLFRGYWELGLGLWGAALLLFLVLTRDKHSWLYRGPRVLPVLLVVGAAFLPGWIAFTERPGVPFLSWRITLLVLCALALVAKAFFGKASATSQSRSRWAKICAAAALTILGGTLFLNTRRKAIATSRNFYGVLSVVEINADNPGLDAYKLLHGAVDHGVQYRSDNLRDLPTAYYSRQSGVGLAILNAPGRRVLRPQGSNLRIGVVGLGVGTIATYARPGDYVRFYEINPDVLRFSQERYFTYLHDSAGRVDVVMGDARLSMKHELEAGQPQQFDVLALDAFNGDAIPVHLLTQEAFEIYLQHLDKVDGILAIHVSNLYLDLKQVVLKAAEHFGLAACWIHTSAAGPLSGTSDWMLLSRNPGVLTVSAIAKASTPLNKPSPSLRMWTDDHSNLFQSLK